jgi:FKBP-type peptidyl-prolyl cis-trans isomerases 2
VIKKGSQVTMHYTLTVDGEVVDSSRDRAPFSYVHGQGQIVKGLEIELEGMEAGDTKRTTVEPEDGYGPRRPDALQKVAKSAVHEPDRLKEGDVVSGDSQGRPFQAVVTDIGADEITLDLNHPPAGKALEFDVEILEVA